MSDDKKSPLGCIHVDLGEGNRVDWEGIFSCPRCDKTLDQNAEVFGEYRKHNKSMAILSVETHCTNCGHKDHEAYFVRATRFNGPVLERMKGGRLFVIKPNTHLTGLRQVFSSWWFSITHALGLEKFH